MGASPPRGVRELVEEAIPVELPVRRLQVAVALLVVAAVLGLVAASVAWSGYSGVEGLGELLGEPRADVMGVVKDSDGDPVPNALVAVVGESMSTRSGEDGWYFLEDVSTGRVEMRCEADGRQTVVRKVALERGTYVVDFVSEVGSGTVEVPSSPVPEGGDPSKGAGWTIGAMVIASVMAVVGALTVHTRRSFVLALACSLVALLTWGWWAGTALAAVVVALIAPLSKEFRSRPRRRVLPWDAETPKKAATGRPAPPPDAPPAVHPGEAVPPPDATATSQEPEERPPLGGVRFG